MAGAVSQARGESPWRLLPALVGALTAGRRKGDGLIRMGFTGAVLAAVFHLMDKQLSEDRKLRREERQALVQTLRETGDATASAMRALAEQVAREDDALRDIRAVVVDRACGTVAGRATR